MPLFCLRRIVATTDRELWSKAALAVSQKDPLFSKTKIMARKKCRIDFFVNKVSSCCGSINKFRFNFFDRTGLVLQEGLFRVTIKSFRFLNLTYNLIVLLKKSYLGLHGNRATGTFF